jgi:uncharacterized YigZ family protein
MADKESFQREIVQEVTESLTEVNRSKFYTFLFPFDLYESLYKKLKEEHPKANHIVYAYRYLNAYDQVVENSTDDGEPKGCAGVPALNVLRGEGIINSGVLIVRYFGGIKLGTGGMVRAYAQSVKDVLAITPRLPYEKQFEHTFTTSYSDIEKTLYQLKQLNITTYEREFGVSEVVWSIKATQEQLEALPT